MVIEYISLVLNALLASGLIGTLLFLRPKRRKENAEAKDKELENTEKVVAIQTEQIERLDTRVEKLEEKVDKLELIIEHKDVEIERNRIIIRQAFKCTACPEGGCPVLAKKKELEQKSPNHHEQHSKRQ